MQGLDLLRYLTAATDSLKKLNLQKKPLQVLKDPVMPADNWTGFSVAQLIVLGIFLLVLGFLGLQCELARGNDGSFAYGLDIFTIILGGIFALVLPATFAVIPNSKAWFK